MDLTADGQVDVVGLTLCDASGDMGKGNWAVHVGGNDGFTEEPLTFTLPTYPIGTFQSFGTFGACFAGGGVDWTPADINGDGLSDMVAVRMCDDSGDIGQTHWLVHLNTGAGYDVTPVEWGLPTGYDANTFADFSRTFCDSEGQVLWSLFDVDGDGQLDLVGTDGCSDDAVTGRTEWTVHRGTSSGFEDVPTSYLVPTGYGPDDFDATFNTDCLRGTSPVWTLSDLDGDGDPDIAATSLCDGSGGVGLDHWNVHLNNGGGFDDPAISWPLPSTYAAGTFTAGLYNTICEYGVSEALYSVVDADGDGLPDVVATDMCAAGSDVGRLRWEVWRNLGNGFDVAHIDWWLPQDQPPGTFTALGSVACLTGAALEWTYADVSGDGAADIVGTARCDDGGGVGSAHWLVYDAACNVPEPTLGTTGTTAPTTPPTTPPVP